MPDIYYVLGGPHLTSLPSQSLKNTPAADYVIAGEGEYTMSELATRLEKGEKEFPDLLNLVWRKGDRIIENPRGPMIDDLDALPFPAYHLVDVDRYSPSVVYRVSAKSTFIETSRGCAAFCTFCANNVTGRRLRVHSIDYVINLIKHLIETYNLTHFSYCR